MAFTINFKNILDLYGIYGGSILGSSLSTLDENTSIFFNYADFNHDGVIDRNEYDYLLGSRGFDPSTADNIFDGSGSNPSFDTDGDNALTEAEFTAMLQNYDNGDGYLDFTETLNFYNSVSDGYIDPTTSFDQYDAILNNSISTIETYDSDGTTSGITTIDEVGKYLEPWGIKDGNATASDIVNLYDTNGDGQVNLEEYIATYLQWDTNNDGLIDYANGEGSAYMDVLPGVYQIPQDQIEQMVQSLIFSIDKQENLAISKEEYEKYLQGFGFPKIMADQLITLYGGSDGEVDFDEMVSAYRSFDTNGDGQFSYEEMVAFQNELTVVDIDTSVISEQQYPGLFQMASSVIRSMDQDKDGEVTVEEYRGVLKQMYQNPNIDKDPPLHAAENFIRLFDMDKSGTVNIIEAMNKYAQYDTNSDGKISASESNNLQAKLEDSSLYDTVNEEIMDIADKDKDSRLTLDEYTFFLKENAMPEYIADDAFLAFDANLDNELSRLELMEAFSRYDNNVENLDELNKVLADLGNLPAATPHITYLQTLSAADYVLYNGDQDNNLDADEKLQMFEDLALTDYGTIGYNAEHSKINQYEPIMNVLEEFVKETDFNKDGLINSDEYKRYLKNEGLPDYFADNAIATYDINGDNHLDFLEWIKVNLDYDANVDGELQMDEVLTMCSDLSGVALTIDDTNVDQHTYLYDAASLIMENYDLNGDRILEANELEPYMKEYGMPTDFAANFVAAHNIGTNADNGLDVVELLRAHVDFDANANGILEFEEEFALYDNMMPVNLGIDSTNAKQYEKINNQTSDLIKNYDDNKDNKLDNLELSRFFKDEGMTEDDVTLALSSFDVNGPDSAIDVLEFMKMYYDFDANKDGNVDNIENMALFDYLTGTGLNPNEANSIQLEKLELDVDGIINNYDMDKDNKLSSAELQERMKALKLPDYIADEAISLYDLDGDGQLDKMEFMKAKADVDTNNNGVLEFNEELSLYSNASGANLNPTDDEIDQYLTIYEHALVLFKKNDNITDRILNSDELKSYFTDLKLPEYMSTEAINMYDLNGDNGLDIYEWMKAQLAYDIDNSGVLEFNEKMAMNAKIADPDVPLDPHTMDEAQIRNLYNYSMNYITNVDTDLDNRMSVDEYATHLISKGLSDNVANDVIASQDLNGDGHLDLMEWLNTNMVLDKNTNGSIDFNELMDLYQDATGIAFNATEANTPQYKNLYTYSNNYINNVDASNNNKISGAEYGAFLKTKGFDEELGASLVSAYDMNGDNELDMLELMKTFIDLDTNNNGSFDFNEVIEYYDNALPNLTFDATESNIPQYKGLFNYSNEYIANVDTSNDNKISADEYSTFLKSKGFSEDLGVRLVNTYDTNGDGLDNLELMRSFLDLDVNTNGKFDFNELIEYYDNAIPSLSFDATNSNISQYKDLYTYSKNYVANIDKNNDNEITEDEYKLYITSLGLPDYMASNAISQFDQDGDSAVDMMEFMRGFLNYDTDNSGNNQFNERMQMYVDMANVSGINFSTDLTNYAQHRDLYEYAKKIVNNLDMDNNQVMSSVEYEHYLNKLGLPQYLSEGIVGQYDLNGDSAIDAMELTQAYIDLDANNTGALEFNELLTYYETIASGYNSFSFSPTIDNMYQLKRLYDLGNNIVKNRDLNFDQMVQANEYELALKAAGFQDYQIMASNAVSSFDTNGDGGIDAFEWMDAILSFDANGSGNLDGDEKTAFYNSML